MKRLLSALPLFRIFEVAFVVLLGAGVGIGCLTFFYADGVSYMFNDPKGCANCHVMQEKYDSWVRQPHARVATCNDCHLPDNKVTKWVTKADNGMRHSFVFTFLKVPTHIRAIPRSQQVAADNCERCHGSMARHAVGGAFGNQESLRCIDCHQDVGHEH